MTALKQLLSHHSVALQVRSNRETTFLQGATLMFIEVQLYTSHINAYESPMP